MVIKIFKFLTTIALIGVFFAVFSNRDVYTELQDKISSTSLNAANDVSSLLEENFKRASESLPLIKEPFASTSNDVPLFTPSVTPLDNTTVPRTVSAKELIYDELNESQSDTDESYRPKISPCTEKMGYKIGTFDTRFDISKETFIKEVDQAAKLWSQAANKELFYYDETGPLTINLIYDERQATTVNVNFLALEIENAKKSANSMRTVYEQEKSVYVEDTARLDSDINNFQIRQKAYTEKVTTYNASGGAQKIEYDAMTLELANLKQEAETLDNRKNALILFMNSINQKVTRYNESIKYINSLIKQSNALGTRKFTEGRFTPLTNTIDIYQYNDSVKLLRVLSHEFGHVIGINHNSNSNSIMYSSNSATTTTLSKEDTADLRKACPTL